MAKNTNPILWLFCWLVGIHTIPYKNPLSTKGHLVRLWDLFWGGRGADNTVTTLCGAFFFVEKLLILAQGSSCWFFEVLPPVRKMILHQEFTPKTHQKKVEKRGSDTFWPQCRWLLVAETGQSRNFAGQSRYQRILSAAAASCINGSSFKLDPPKTLRKNAVLWLLGSLSALDAKFASQANLSIPHHPNHPISNLSTTSIRPDFSFSLLLGGKAGETRRLSPFQKTTTQPEGVETP